MGVFARDELPSKQKLLQTKKKSGNLPFTHVINSQPANEPGQHWLAIYGKPAPLESSSVAAQNVGLLNYIEFVYFYALPPNAYSLPTHFKSISNYLQLPLQLTHSFLSGHYFLYFLFIYSHIYTFPSNIS